MILRIKLLLFKNSHYKKWLFCCLALKKVVSLGNMLKSYFQIIRKALSENRVKGSGVYYEAHHIIPKSFNKKSSTVLLIPQEHYECHKILAQELGRHPIYGQKMLWAFHRLAYDKQRKLTADQYAEARLVLASLWARKKTEEHKQKISEAQKGNTNNRSRVYKGMKSDMSEDGRRRVAESRRREQLGKVGSEANASKGVVICEYDNGVKIEAGSALQLANLISLPQSTVSHRLCKSPGIMKKGFKIYYK